MFVDNLNHSDFFNLYNAKMNADEILIIDIIDKAYNNIPEMTLILQTDQSQPLSNDHLDAEPV